jgi:hypothetical protein
MSPEEIHLIEPNPAPAVEGTPEAVKQAGHTFRAFKQGNMPLVVLFAAGIACVYLLSLRQGPARASAQQQADELRVESALIQLRVRADEAKTPAGSAAAMAGSAAALVETFYYETKQRQIPPDQLAGNPFEFKPPKKESPKSVAALPTESEEPLGDATRYGDALTAVKQLRLQSVLSGPYGATAMISNNLLTEGQVICGWTVSKIQPQSVILTWKDQTYELKMP